MLTTQIYGHYIQCNFILNDIEENEDLIDSSTIKEQLENGNTSGIGIEVIDSDGESAGYMSWNIQPEELKIPEDDEHTITLLGHLVAYRFRNQPNTKLTDSGEEHIEEALKQGIWSGEVNESNPDNFEDTYFGNWRTL